MVSRFPAASLRPEKRLGPGLEHVTLRLCLHGGGVAWGGLPKLGVLPVFFCWFLGPKNGVGGKIGSLQCLGAKERIGVKKVV